MRPRTQARARRNAPLKKRLQRIFAVLLALALLALGPAACSQDPTNALLQDVFGLIDEFYLTATDGKDLLTDAFLGMEKTLAFREAEEKRKSAEEKPGAAVSDSERTPPEKNGDENPPDPVSKAPDLKTPPLPEKPIEPAGPFPVMDFENGEKPAELKGPLTVTAENGTVALEIGDDRLSLDLPSDRKEMVRTLLAGYRFVLDGTGPDPDKELLYNALAYMAGRLDPHSTFLPPKRYGQLKDETSGHFGGVGIEVSMRGDLLTVVAPIEGTPAGKAGLLPMDRIIKVDGKSTLNMTLYNAVSLIRGKIGTTVVLTIRRAGPGAEKTFDVSLERSQIPVHTAKAKMLPGKIGWVRVFSFNATTGPDLKKELADLEAEHGDARGIILDLRNNPGGLFGQAVEVANLFLESGMIVNTIGRGRLREKETFATLLKTRGEIPMVVLISGGSASGSEIVAGALQDHGRALLLGTRTFGKGSVQSIFKLQGDTGLRITTALYYTPSGRSIQAEGIVPDVLTRLPEMHEKWLSLRSESALSGHLESNATSGDKADVVVDAMKIKDAYLKRGEIVEDEDYPEKGDWLLVLARQILEGKQLTVPAMLERAKKILAPMK